MADTGFVTPTLSELRARIAADLRAEMPDESSRFRRWAVNVLGVVMAGVTWLLYLYLDWIARQVLVDLATTDNLERHAGIWGLEPTLAAVASGNLTLTGTIASVVPIDTVFQLADGTRYTADAEVTFASTSATVAVTAEEAGDAGNAAAGAAVFLVSPISGVTTEGVVAAGGLTGGQDDETSDSLRERVLERIRTPPQGGAEADYIAWGQAALATVDRVWPVGGDPAPGHVTVYFTVEYDGSDPASIIPTAGNVTTVNAYIEPRVPVGVTGYVTAAPTADEVNLTIALVDDTSAIRAAVTEELVALLLRKMDPTAGAGGCLNSEVRAAIGRATETYTLTAVDGGAGTADVAASAAGEVRTLGTITWA